MCTADTKQAVNQIDVAINEASITKLSLDLCMDVLSQVEHSLPTGSDERRKFNASLNTTSGCSVCTCENGQKAMVIFQPNRNLLDGIDHTGVVRAVLEKALEIKFTEENLLPFREFNPDYLYQTATTKRDVIIVLRTS